MIEQVLAGGDDYELLWDLIGAIRDGFSIKKMRPLLTSDDRRITAIGAYLAYELGDEMQPLLDELIPLADHPEPQCRSDIVHALIECAGPNDLDALSRIMLAFDDPEPFVHRAAIQFVIVADDRSLASAVSEVAKRYPGSPFKTVLFMLLENRTRLDSCALCVMEAKLTEFISHEAAIVRRFGVGLAARPRLVVNVAFLEIAKDCGDDEGLSMIDHEMWSPTLKRAHLARIEFLQSGLERGEQSPTIRRRKRT